MDDGDHVLRIDAGGNVWSSWLAKQSPLVRASLPPEPAYWHTGLFLRLDERALRLPALDDADFVYILYCALRELMQYMNCRLVRQKDTESAPAEQLLRFEAAQSAQSADEEDPLPKRLLAELCYVLVRAASTKTDVTMRAFEGLIYRVRTELSRTADAAVQAPELRLSSHPRYLADMSAIDRFLAGRGASTWLFDMYWHYPHAATGYQTIYVMDGDVCVGVCTVDEQTIERTAEGALLFTDVDCLKTLTRRILGLTAEREALIARYHLESNFQYEYMRIELQIQRLHDQRVYCWLMRTPVRPLRPLVHYCSQYTEDIMTASSGMARDVRPPSRAGADDLTPIELPNIQAHQYEERNLLDHLQQPDDKRQRFYVLHGLIAHKVGARLWSFYRTHIRERGGGVLLVAQMLPTALRWWMERGVALLEPESQGPNASPDELAYGYRLVV